MSYRAEDYFELKFAALLQNGIVTENPGPFMRVEVDGKKVYFGHKKGEAYLQWTNGYDPKEHFECCCEERVAKEKYTSYRDCPSDLIKSVVAGYIQYADLRDAFANVEVVVRS